MFVLKIFIGILMHLICVKSPRGPMDVFDMYCCRGGRITSGGRADHEGEDDDQDWDDEGHDFDRKENNDCDGGGEPKVVGEDGIGRYST